MFDADLRIVWRQVRPPNAAEPHLSAPSMTIREIAEREAGRHSVLRLQTAERGINAAMWEQLPLARAYYEIMEVTTSITADQGVVRAAEELMLARAGLEVDRVERRRVQERVEFVRETVLRDPATAKLYLLLDSGLISGAVASVEQLPDLVSEVANWNPAGTWMRVSQILLEFLQGQSATAREHALREFCHLMALHKHDDLVERVRLIFEDAEAGTDTGLR